MALDREPNASLNLGILWRELALGLCRVRDAFCSESSCYLVTAPVENAARPLDSTRLLVLEAILAGNAQKTIAIDLEVAPSTVAAYARAALRHFGFEHRPSQVQPLLMLVAKAARGVDSSCHGRVSFLEHQNETFRVIAAPRPDLELPDVPPAELSVLRCLVEGMPYAEIARRRGTSTRTIANQLSAAFRRHGVSGRCELILRLFDVKQASSAAGPKLELEPSYAP
jgi:DNA-binding NarL/FixJ family response regulator